MSSSRRTLMTVNLVLAVAVAAMAWFLFNDSQSTFIQPAATPSTVARSTTPVTTSTISAADTQAIEALQQQLEKEKSLADQARSQIEARELDQAKKQLEQVTNQSVAKPAQPIKKPAEPTAESAGLDVAQQKALIADAIKAQLGGASDGNAQASKKKTKQRPVVASPVVASDSASLATRLINLDNDSKDLFQKLLLDGNKISRSDQAYINAMFPGPQAIPPKLTDTDLINRVEVSDSGDQGSISAKVRTVVNEMMEKETPGDKAPKKSKVTIASVEIQPGQSGNVQNTIDELMERNAERERERQFNDDASFLESLAPLEQERRSETRWVTVKRGDTLYDISNRVYGNGFLYHKIFEANPQVLAHPDLIKPGQRLRVPL